jgi:hypothetical protein
MFDFTIRSKRISEIVVFVSNELFYLLINFSSAWLFHFNIIFVFVLRYNELILEKNVLMFPYSIKETSSEKMNEFSRNCFMLIDD